MKTCPICKKLFDEYYTTYCSLSCSNVARRYKNEVEYLKSPKLCKSCGGAVPYARRHYNVFCSSSCAATFNNVRKRKKEYTCRKCGVKKKQYCCTKLCKRCRFIVGVKKFGERTLESFKSTFSRHRYQMVRHHAHQVVRIFGIAKSCMVCSYSTHVELAHKKSIGSFSGNATLNQINDLNNLVYLCPNHHWELDSGILNF